MQLQSWVALIKDIVTAIAAGTAAVIGVLGLRAWKAQLKGKTEYETARTLLRCVYKVRDAIRSVRNPLQGAGEIAQALKESGVVIERPDPRFQIASEEAVYQRRWVGVRDAWQELDLAAFEAEVLWGKDTRDVLAPLRACAAELYSYIQMHLRYVESPPKNPKPGQSENIDKVIYDGLDDPQENPFTRKMAEAVTGIEDFIRPRLRL